MLHIIITGNISLSPQTLEVPSQTHHFPGTDEPKCPNWDVYNANTIQDQQKLSNLTSNR